MSTTYNPYQTENLPYSLENEQAVIGAVLFYPAVFPYLVDVISPNDFYRRPHQMIFAVMLDLFSLGEPIDILTVSENLNDKAQLKLCGGRNYIMELAMCVVTTANVEYYATKIVEYRKNNIWLN